MLPPDLAAFSFRLDRAGADAALAARTLAGCPTGRLLVLGASRFRLLLELAGAGRDVVATDPSRTALDAARRAAEHAGLSDRLTLFAADPRDVVVPGGVSGAVLTSAAFRIVAAAESRRQMLDCLRVAVGPGGTLCLDLDRLPASDASTTDWTPLRDGPGHQRWSWRVDPARGLATVACETPETGRVELELADASPEAALAELRAAGFEVRLAQDAATGEPLGAGSERAWVVARAAGG